MKKRIHIWLLLASLFFITGIYPGNGIKAQAASSPVSICTKEEWEMLKLVNQERMAQSLAPLSTFSKLQKAADIRTVELVTLFDHIRPNGSECFTALAEAGADTYNYAGENIAAGYTSAKTAMNGWMESSGHKLNILNANFTHLGAGYYYDADSYYERQWVQLFTGTCMPISISVKNGDTVKSYKQGTTIEGMNRALVIKCKHGTGYMPVLTKMCSGYKKNNTGTQTIKVTYESQSVQFKVKITGTVTSISIKDATIQNIKNKTYTGKNITQSPKVVLAGTALIKNTDYTVSYKNNKNAGTATIIVKGKGKYSGTVNRTFTINVRSIKGMAVSDIKKQSYTGKRVKPKITIKYNGTTISNKYYTLKYINNIKAGTAKVIIKGKGNISGTITIKFKIVKKNT